MQVKLSCNRLQKIKVAWNNSGNLYAFKINPPLKQRALCKQLS